MENLKLENLDNELISFDLSPEDMEAIKGGTSAPKDISTGSNCPSPPKRPFAILIVAVPPKRPFTITIVAVPPKCKDD
ncbi:hypothetical protein [uncultured Nostoc sp.]|uniref:hypothetical protein n=1 Tax=uncultured Nostoc sp. TaxID=340711 RepID=UPI0035CC27B1